MSTGPLDGIRVLDFTANMSGPFATMVLGDQGADVIKVEAPNGDGVRQLGTRLGDISTYFANLNRSKRSACLDLLRAEARPVLDFLLDSADVVVHNFRPKAAERLGIDYATVRKDRPNVVYASIIGLGNAPDAAELPVYDHIVQAMSGIAAQQGTGRSEPELVRHGLVDKATGLVLAQAVTASLLKRDQTGVGSQVEVCMLDVALAFLWPDAMMSHTALNDVVERRPSISNSFRLTKTLDGHIAIAVATARQWSGLASITNARLPPDADPTQLMSWHKCGRSILQAFARWAIATSTTVAIDTLRMVGVPGAPVVPLDELHQQSQIQANEVLEVVEHPRLGPIRQPRPSSLFNGDRPLLRELRPAPSIGEHTYQILAELGFEESEIDHLFRLGVANDGEH
jgi:crotonobetainyl-CoA:carnitine CoA-transferase CaiB-like acyl-CoA transferase